MLININHLSLLLFINALLFSFTSRSVEFDISGVVDFRVTANDTIQSFRDGGYGKFDLSNNDSLSLSQAGVQFITSFDNGFSAHLIFNAYSNKDKTKAGLTEGFIKYKSLPNKHGYRWQTKLGIFYPDFSIENHGLAWSSPNTLNSSSINTWLGEEIRVLGNEYKIVRLGKFHNNNYDISLSGAAFINNDPAGTLLAWHGWTSGNRQTLWTEKVLLPPLPIIQPGGQLATTQSQVADPFFEVDNVLGAYLKSEIKWHRKGAISVAAYTNSAKPYEVKEQQYGWKTEFLHVSARWLFDNGLLVSSQYINGTTVMQDANREDVVNSDFRSGFVSLSKRFASHKVTMRLEEFSVVDNDITPFDDNSEYGKSGTLNYTYRLNKSWFLSSEYTWIKSRRAARAYTGDSIHLTEQQLQLAARYFFK